MAPKYKLNCVNKDCQKNDLNRRTAWSLYYESIGENKRILFDANKIRNEMKRNSENNNEKIPEYILSTIREYEELLKIECVICSELLTSESIVFMKKCFHRVCKNCNDNLKERKIFTCPICREEQ